MNDSIKPCPFCGNQVTMRRGLNGIIFFECRNCGAITSFRGINSPNVKNPTRAWNRRTDNENGGAK